jgi:hypothetical protein
MLTPITEMPAGAIGFAASGRVTSDDRRTVLEPTIASALARGDKVKLLYVAGPEFAGYDAELPWDDAVFGTRHFMDFERIAFVADGESPYRRAVAALEGFLPATLRLFATRDLAMAKAWVGA